MSYVAVGEGYKKGNVVDGKIYIDNIYLYFEQVGKEGKNIYKLIINWLNQ